MGRIARLGGGGTLTRSVPRPATSWDGTWLSSLMPLQYADQYWWIRAKPTTDLGHGLSLEAITERIRSDGVEFAVEQSCGAQEFRPLVRLTLNEVVATDEEHDISFDPAINSAREVRLAPGWLADFRQRAYRRSRAGRDAP